MTEPLPRFQELPKESQKSFFLSLYTRAQATSNDLKGMPVDEVARKLFEQKIIPAIEQLAGEFQVDFKYQQDIVVEIDGSGQLFLRFINDVDPSIFEAG